MNDDLRKMAPWLGAILAVALGGMFARGLFLGRLEGDEAPAFELPIMAGEGAAEGDRVSLDALRGRVVVLDFWASWCPPCRESIPILNDVRSRLGGEPVTFLGVNVEAELGPRRLEQVHADFGAEFPSVQDETGSVKQRYAVQVLPTLVVLDPNGVVHEVETGVPNARSLESAIRGALAVAPPTSPTTPAEETTP